MPRHTLAPPLPLPATLAEQKTDFTAEGSPPPGKVATAPPKTRRVRGTLGVKRPPAGRYP